MSWTAFPPVDWVVTNPPFAAAMPILQYAVAHARVGVALYLRLSFLEPTRACGPWLEAHPPTRVLVLPRHSFSGDGKTDSVTGAWMVWRRDRVATGAIQIRSKQSCGIARSLSRRGGDGDGDGDR